MKTQRLFSIAILAALLSLVVARDVSAQPANLRADVERSKEEISELKKLTVAIPTLAQAVSELAKKMSAIELSLDEHARSAASVPNAVEELEGLGERYRELRRELEYLRTQVADIEQPAVQTSLILRDSKRGLRIANADGTYSFELGGFLQTRYTASLSSGDENGIETEDSSLSIRRARIHMGGTLGEEYFQYFTQFDLSQSNPLVDFLAIYNYRPWMSIQIGQGKVPFTRSFLAVSRDRIFHELNQSQDRVRYDRDIGVWASGWLFGNTLKYNFAVTNGSGTPGILGPAAAQNDNIDFAESLRLEGVVAGDYIEPGFGATNAKRELQLTLGAAFVHNLVALPAQIAGIEVGDQDVDNDGIIDNIRVLSGVIDAHMRYGGFELFVEGTWRHERWAGILDSVVDENASLAALVDASDAGRRNYLGLTGQASYFILPDRLLFATRLGHGRLPVLPVGGANTIAPPLAQRAWQWDMGLQLFREGARRAGITYSLVNFDAKEGADPARDKLHTFLLEAQLIL